MPAHKRKRGTLLRKRGNKRAFHETPADIIAKVDRRVLELLTELGSDTKKPHEVSFWIYIPVEEQAYQAAKELEKQQFDVELVPPSDGHNTWLCLAYKHFVPRFAAIERYRKQLTDLAARFGGEFDGWEMKVEE